jgi:hypothetical protein
VKANYRPGRPRAQLFHALKVSFSFLSTPYFIEPSIPAGEAGHRMGEKNRLSINARMRAFDTKIAGFLRGAIGVNRYGEVNKNFFIFFQFCL